MKKTIRISGGISATIATGSFQNLKPSFSWEEVIEDCDLNDTQIEERIRTLYDKSSAMLHEAEQKAIVERIQRERKDLRFLPSPKTKIILPSVTSIINYDADFFVSGEDLAQYCAQGNIIDKKVKHFIAEHKWVNAKDIKDNWTDIVILTKGGLKLETDVGDFPAFLEKYFVENMEVGKRFFCDEYGFTGEPDFTGIPQFKDAKEVPTIFDVKRTPSSHSNGQQLAAYCKANGIKQGIIVPLSGKTQQGYSKPVIYGEDKLEGYWKMFCAKQKEFKKRYNV